MGACHKMHEDQWVEDAKPQRLRRRDAAVEGNLGDRPRKHHYASDGQQAHHQRAAVGMGTGELGDAFGQEEPELSVWSGRFRPHRVDAVVEPPRNTRRATRVRIDPCDHQLALGEVGVHVPTK